MTSSTTQPAHLDGEQVNAALPAAYQVLEAINSGDLSRIPECVTADFVDHGAPPGVPPGPAAYAETLGFVSSVLGIRYAMEDLVQTPDRIVVRATASGEGVAHIHGPAAAGRPYTMATVHIFRTEGDRLAEHWGVRDEVGAMRQIGVIPPPGRP